MKKPVSSWSIIGTSTVVVCCALLYACTQERVMQSSSKLEVILPPPQQVLKAAALRSELTENAEFAMELTNERNIPGFSQSETTARIDGILQDYGKELQMRMWVTSEATSGDTEQAITGSGDMIILADQTVFAYVGELDVKPPDSLVRDSSIEKLVGTWWTLPSDEKDNPLETINPVASDPRLLRAQTEVVRIVEDMGIATVDERDVHHYRVEIDEEKFVEFLQKTESDATESETQDMRNALADMQMTGQLWIDKENHVLRRVQWTIRSAALPNDTGVQQLTIDVRIFNHNDAPSIQPPTNAVLFSPLIFSDEKTLPPSVDVPDLNGFENLSLEEQQKLLQQMMGGS